ncbi:hypothetical protein GIB67_029688, partial [Kingdonia uniflora]
NICSIIRIFTTALVRGNLIFICFLKKSKKIAKTYTIQKIKLHLLYTLKQKHNSITYFIYKYYWPTKNPCTLVTSYIHVPYNKSKKPWIEKQKKGSTVASKPNDQYSGVQAITSKVVTGPRIGSVINLL